MKRTRCLSTLAGLAFFLATLPVAVFAQPALTFPNFRPYDQKGLNVFEPEKEDVATPWATQLRWGAAFTQQFQALSHSNEATPVLDANGVNRNQLIDIGWGTNLATANLNLDAQLTPGVRVNLIAYLSSRHHSETWVKGGFVQVDGLPFLQSQTIDNLMQYVTLRLGHFEINYGDAHFRRTDNGNALYNPFVGNTIMDAFTTEVGGEVYLRSNGLIGMVGLTGGEIQGGVTRPDDRAPSIYGKLGFDRQLSPDLRVRLTGSAYTTSKSLNNTLYSGDRAGSRFYLVMENTAASPAAQFTSGRINPGFRNEVTSIMVNPFVKYRGLELFGVIEQATGSAVTEAENRTWNQYAVDAVYRFLPREQAYVGGRYNVVTGPLAVGASDVSVNRIELAAGWFATPNLLLKGAYVTQNYDDFAPTDIRHGGKFDGFVIEGVIAF